MKNRNCLAALAAALLISGGTAAQADELIRTQVSAPGSTMFVISTHLASVLNERHGYTVEVATGFPGVRSQVNIAMGEADMGIYAPPLASFLQNGVAMYSGLENHAELADKLRVLSSYSGDMFTLGTYDSSIQTVADLEGKRVFLGPQGAALVRINASLIEAATGLVAGDDYELVHVDWAGSAALLQDGSVDVLFQLCATGCATWTELATAREVTFIGYTPEMIETEEFQSQLNKPGRLIREIAPGTWGDNQTNDAPVMVVSEFTGLVVSEEMSDDVAYNITAALWETLPDLHAVAPFTQEYEIQTATFGAIYGMHPGAMKYLSENGVEE
ncbi:MAG: TAXI family TRAP transporter solute-binding subunit [Pseudomonadota bacterium]